MPSVEKERVSYDATVGGKGQEIGRYQGAVEESCSVAHSVCFSLVYSLQMCYEI